MIVFRLHTDNSVQFPFRIFHWIIHAKPISYGLQIIKSQNQYVYVVIIQPTADISYTSFKSLEHSFPSAFANSQEILILSKNNF